MKYLTLNKNAKQIKEIASRLDAINIVVENVRTNKVSKAKTKFREGMVLVTDENGRMTESDIYASKLEFLNNVTSPIQTQINTIQNTLSNDLYINLMNDYSRYRNKITLISTELSTRIYNISLDNIPEGSKNKYIINNTIDGDLNVSGTLKVAEDINVTGSYSAVNTTRYKADNIELIQTETGNADIQKFPPEGLTNNTTVIQENITINTKASSVYENDASFFPFRAFNSTNTSWKTSSKYTTSNGESINLYNTNITKNLNSSTVFYGISGNISNNLTTEFDSGKLINMIPYYQTNGMVYSEDFVAKCITFLPSTPSNGVLWEAGSTDSGAWLGFKDDGNILRLRAGNGETINKTSGYDHFVQFNENGTITFTNTTVCDVLVVGGGGSGGQRHAGGGGAGACIYLRSQTFSPGTYTITIGQGGVKPLTSSHPFYGNNGEDTYITNASNQVLYRAKGGGGGGQGPDAKEGLSGGSSGGSSASGGTLLISPNPLNTENIPSGIYGNKGGNTTYLSSSEDSYAGCGGGGAGSVGGNNVSPSISGNGGKGRVINITGINKVYAAGGGGGCAATATSAGQGGGALINGVLDIVGGAGSKGAVAAESGMNNTGSGGGGSGFSGVSNGTAGSGGSGVVILRWSGAIVPTVTNTTITSIEDTIPVLYPKIPMTGFSTTDNTTGITYRATSYDNYGTDTSWKAFDNSNTRYVSANDFTNVNAGYLSITGVSFGNDTNYKGVYLAIDMGEKIYIGNYSIEPGYNYYNPPTNNRLPKNWKIYATNNDSCWNSNNTLNIGSTYGWVEIDERKAKTGYNHYTKFEINSLKPYRYYAIHVNAIGSKDPYGGYWDISNWFIYGNTTPSFTSTIDRDLLVHLNFEENLIDESGDGNTITPYGNPTFNNNIKKYGTHSIYFDGNEQYLKLPPTNFSIFDGLTFATWVYFTDSTRVTERIIDFGNGAPSNNIEIKRGNENDLEIVMNNVTIASGYTFTNAIVNNTWMHICWTIEKSPVVWKVYINNVLTTPSSITNSVFWPNNVVLQNCYIANNAWSPSNPYFKGYIDDFRIYTRAITIDEVNKVYNGLKIKTSSNIQDPDLLLGLKFNNDVVDNSLYNNNVVSYLEPPVFENSQAKYRNSIYFNGTNQYLTIPSRNFYSFNGLSFATWIYCTQSSSGQRIIDFSNANKTDAIHIYRDLVTSNLIVLIGNGSYTNISYIKYDNVLTNNTWIHICWTIQKSPTAYKLYINGVEKTGTSTGTARWVSNTNITECYIGKAQDSTAYFKGYMDDFRIYTRVISSSEVNKVYNGDNLIDDQNIIRDILTSDNVAVIDLLKSEIETYLDDNYHEIVWEVRVGGNERSGSGRVRLWIDGDKVGEGLTKGTYKALGNGIWTSVDQGGFGIASTNVTSGEHTTPWPYTILGKLEYYRSRLVNPNYQKQTITNYPEWIAIDCGGEIILSYFIIHPVESYEYRRPKEFKLYASNDNLSYTNAVYDQNWVLIYQGVEEDKYSNSGASSSTHFTTDNTTKYRYYMLVIDKIFTKDNIGVTSSVEIAELEFFTITSLSSTTSDLNLLLEMKFDGDLTDTSTNSRTATNGGTAVVSNTFYKYGTGSLRCTSDLTSYVDIPNINYGATDGVTISFWVYYESFNSNWTRIFNSGTSVFNEKVIVFNSDTSNKLNIIITQGTASPRADWGPTTGSLDYTFSLQTWTHITMTLTKTTLVSGSLYNATGEIYINGSSFNTNTNLLYPVNENSPITRLGYDIAGSQSKFNGYLDDVRIYNRALTASEVTKVYNGEGLSLSVSDPALLTEPTLKVSQAGTLNIIDVYSGLQPVFSVKQDGNVGLGTLAPNEKLDVRGNMKVSGTINGITNDELSNLSGVVDNIQYQLDSLVENSDETKDIMLDDIVNSEQIILNEIEANDIEFNKYSSTLQQNAVDILDSLADGKQTTLVYGNGLEYDAGTNTLNLTQSTESEWQVTTGDGSSQYIFDNSLTTGGGVLDGASTTYINLLPLSYSSGSKLNKWHFYTVVANKNITPIILEYVGNTTQYILRGIGTTRTSIVGLNTFDFEVVEGSDVFVNNNYQFGWKDGTKTTSNTGVILFYNDNTITLTASTYALTGNSSTAISLGTTYTFGNTFLSKRRYRFKLEFVYNSSLDTSQRIKYGHVNVYDNYITIDNGASGDNLVSVSAVNNKIESSDVTGAITSIANNNLNINSILVSRSDGKIGAYSEDQVYIQPSQLDNITTLTSSAQTQINQINTNITSTSNQIRTLVNNYNNITNYVDIVASEKQAVLNTKQDALVIGQGLEYNQTTNTLQIAGATEVSNTVIAEAVIGENWIARNFFDDTTNLMNWYSFDTSNFVLNRGYLGTKYDLTNINATIDTTDPAVGDADANLTVSSAYLQMNNTFSTSGLTSCSIAFWMKKSALNTGWDVVLHDSGTSTATYNEFRINRYSNTNYWRVRVFNSLINTDGYLNDWVSSDLNIWHHYVFNISKTINNKINVTVYKDGSIVGSSTDEASTWTYGTINNLLIGRHNNNNASLQGYLDDFRMYDRILTVDEIDKLYNKTTTTEYISFGDNPLSSFNEYSLNHYGTDVFYNNTNNVIGWFKLDGTLIDHSQKINDGLISAVGNVTNDSTIKICDNSSMTFDGESFIKVSNPDENAEYFNPSAMTVSFWIYGYSKGEKEQTIISANKTSAYSGWLLNILSSGLLSFKYGTSTGWARYDIPNTDLSARSTEWINITLCFSDKLVFLYIDGVYKSSAILTDPSLSYGSDALVIGSNDVNMFYLNANTKLNEVRIYDRTLTAKEAWTLYYVSGYNALYKPLLEGNGDLVAWYKFDGDFNDSSGNGYNITTSANTSFEINNNRNCIKTLSGANITLPSEIHPYNIWNNSDSGITFSVFFRVDTSTGQSGRLFDFQQSATTDSDIYVGIKSGTGHAMYLKCNGSVYTYGNHATTLGTPLDGNWHHFAWAIDKSGVWNVYYDGTNLNVNITKALRQNTTYNIRYLSDSAYAADSSLIGNLDDVRIYNRVLTADEIGKLYNNASNVISQKTKFSYVSVYNNYISLTPTFKSIQPEIVMNNIIQEPKSILGTDYQYMAFTSNGTITFAKDTVCDILVVGGGGGGGGTLGGGGGGGAVVYAESANILSGTYSIVIGAGGTSVTGNSSGIKGGTSSFNGILAEGGGGGSYFSENINGDQGGSGGGGASDLSSTTPNPLGGLVGTNSTLNSFSGSIYQNKGGDGLPRNTNLAGGGGGGAGEAGANGNISQNGIGGKGGDGIQINIDGKNYYWGAGGGGSAYDGTAGSGGLGGGGGGAVNNGTVGTGGSGGKNTASNASGSVGGNAGANTGSGGGAGGWVGATGGSGGSGIVIIRWKQVSEKTIATMNDVAKKQDMITFGKGLIYDDESKTLTTSGWKDNSSYLSRGLTKIYDNSIIMDTNVRNYSIYTQYKEFFYDTTDMVAWYKFDGDFNDSSGNGYNLTNNNVSFSSEYTINGASKSAYFNSSLSAYLSNTEINLNNIDRTVSCWAYIPTNEYQTLLSFGDTTVASPTIVTGFFLGWIGANQTLFLHQNDNTDASTTASYTNYYSKWTHVTFRYDHKTENIYINGNLVYQVTFTNPDNMTLGTFLIGKWWGFENRYLNGYISDLRIYNRALTADEIGKLYYHYLPYGERYDLENNILAWYKFDDATNPGLNSSSLGAVLNADTNGTPSIVSDKFMTGQSSLLLSGGGQDDALVVDANSNKLYTYLYQKSITISVWCWSKSAGQNNYGRIFCGAPVGTSTVQNNGFQLRHETNNQLSIQIGTPVTLTTTGMPALNTKWTHVVCIIEPTSTNWSVSEHNLKIYLDGVLDVSTNSSPYPVITENYNFQIGRWTINEDSREYDGYLDDFRIYNRALSADEVYQLYGSTVATIQKDIEIIDNKADMLGWYKFDGDFTDSSGNYLGSATPYGNLVFDNVNKIYSGASLTFDGASYLQMDNPIIEGTTDVSYWTPTSMTVSFWIYGYSIHTILQTIISARNISGSIYSGMMIYILPSSGNLQWCFGGTGSWMVYEIPYTSISQFVSNWIHIVFTFSGSTMYLYINGVLFSSKEDWSGINFSAANLRIGAGINEGTAQFYLKSGTQLDDVRIYKRALTEEEAVKLYRNYTPAPVIIKKITSEEFYNDITDMVAWYKFDGDFNDSSGNGYHAVQGSSTLATLSNTDKILGTHSLVMPTNNTAAYVTASSGTATNIWSPTSSFSVAFWCKIQQTTTAQVMVSCRSGAPSYLYGWNFVISPNSTNIYFETFNSGSGKISTSFNIGSSVWKHVAATLKYDSSTSVDVVIYIDGIIVQTFSGNYYTPFASSILTIGKSSEDSTYYCKGTSFDDFRIYNRVLTEQEVSILYNISNSDKISGTIETSSVFTTNILPSNDVINLGKHIEITNGTSWTGDSIENNQITNRMSYPGTTALNEYCMRSKRNLWVDGADIIFTSDKRIKKDIKDIDDDSALDKILAVQPKTYKYIEYKDKGYDRVYGFVSQQVKEVLPEATTKVKKFIPNIYQYCVYKNNEIHLPEGFDVSKLVSTYNGTDISDKVRIIGNDDVEYDVTYILISYKTIDENGKNKILHKMKLYGNVNTKSSVENVFVYGTMVDDLTTIDKTYLYTLNVCATQVLSRKIDETKVTTSSIKNRMATVEARLAALENKGNM